MNTLKSLLLFSIIGIVFAFTGCTDEEAVGPTFDSVTINGQSGATVAVLPNSSVIISSTMVPGDAKLDEYKIERSLGNDVTVALSGNDIVIQKDTLTAANVLGEETITLTVTDNDGLTDTKTLTIFTETPGTPLSDATAFTWERVGSGSGTGLDQFGLTWTSNTTTVAVIKKGADKLVVLSVADWSNILTKEDLKTAIDAGTDTGEYTGVSSQQNNTYNDVLGTIKGTEYYIINVQTGTVSTVPAGTQIVIEGEYKN